MTLQENNHSTFNYLLGFLPLLSKKEKIAAWVGILGGGIGFFIMYGYIAELMR